MYHKVTPYFPMKQALGRPKSKKLSQVPPFLLGVQERSRLEMTSCADNFGVIRTICQITHQEISNLYREKPK